MSCICPMLAHACFMGIVLGLLWRCRARMPWAIAPEDTSTVLMPESRRRAIASTSARTRLMWGTFSSEASIRLPTLTTRVENFEISRRKYSGDIERLFSVNVRAP